MATRFLFQTPQLNRSSRVETIGMQKLFFRSTTIQERSDCIIVMVPPRKNWGFILGFVPWMAWGFFIVAMMMFGVVRDLPSMVSARDGFLGTLAFLLWFCLAVGGITYTGSFWLRMVFGVEVTHFSENSILIEQRVLRFKRENLYTRERMIHLRTLPLEKTLLWYSSSRYVTGSPPSLAFDYNAETVRFGKGMNEAEAAQILEWVVTKFPQYGFVPKSEARVASPSAWQ